jgi:CPA2 family monovalent cation:H+ antiporter-2
VAGILLGPTLSPGYFVADMELAQQLSEIGVMLLMFGVGLHLSLDDLLSVKKIALPGAIIQIAVATLMGTGLALLWGWDLFAGLVFGLALSVASTVVVLRTLEAEGALETFTGRIALGWLVVEDLIMVLVLVLLPPLAYFYGEGVGGVITEGGGAASIVRTLSLTLGSVVLFIALMLIVGRRVFPWMLWQVAGTGSRELFTLCVIAAAISIAYGSAVLFGVSFAIGAFFAGMVLQGSDFSHRAAEESLPLRDAFSVIFFVSVGMLFDPRIILTDPRRVLGVILVILGGKSVVTFVLGVGVRYPLNTALTVAARRAQIGEFSFILAGMGVALGVLPVEGQNLILAGAVVSIAINPLLFELIEPGHRWILERSELARMMERRADPLAELPSTISSDAVTGHAVIVGYGRVGRRIGDAVREQGIRIVVVEENREVVQSLRDEGVAAISGDASDPGVLVQAHLTRAQILIIATPDAAAAHRMLNTTRRMRPDLPVVVRSHGDDEAALLRQEISDGEVFIGEHELAVGMIRSVVSRLRLPAS